MWSLDDPDVHQPYCVKCLECYFCTEDKEHCDDGQEHEWKWAGDLE